MTYFLTVLLVALSLHTLVSALEVTFVKQASDRIYVETDPQHYAFYGEYQKKNKPTIVAVIGEHRIRLSAFCEVQCDYLERVEEKVIENYGRIRERYLKEENLSDAISKTPSAGYKWSATFSEDTKKFSVTRLDESTVAYSSKYFPNKLATVIVSGKVVIFIHYDGRVTMKTKECLFANENKLFEGILKIKVDGKSSALWLKKDNPMRIFLMANQLIEEDFDTEQYYFRPMHDKEYNQLLLVARRATRPYLF